MHVYTSYSFILNMKFPYQVSVYMQDGHPNQWKALLESIQCESFGKQQLHVTAFSNIKCVYSIYNSVLV